MVEEQIMLSSRLNPHLDLGKSGKDKPNVDIASEWLMLKVEPFGLESLDLIASLQKGLLQVGY